MSNPNYKEKYRRIVIRIKKNLYEDLNVIADRDADKNGYKKGDNLDKYIRKIFVREVHYSKKYKNIQMEEYDETMQK